MTGGTYLKRSRHGTIYYFRRRIPLDLVHDLGRTHVTLSLQVKDRGAAVQRARSLATSLDRLFEDLRPMGKRRKDNPNSWDFGVKVEFDPATKRVLASFSDVKPDDQPAVDQHLKTIAEFGRDAIPPPAVSGWSHPDDRKRRRDGLVGYRPQGHHAKGIRTNFRPVRQAFRQGHDALSSHPRPLRRVCRSDVCHARMEPEKLMESKSIVAQLALHKIDSDRVSSLPRLQKFTN